MKYIPIYEPLKSLVKRAFRKFGLEIRRVPLRVGLRFNRVDSENLEVDLPPVYDDPLEAFSRNVCEQEVAFKLPLDFLRVKSGFSFASNGYHPFVEALSEYDSEISASSYERSILSTYYEQHQPKSAAEAIPGFNQTPPDFLRLPSYVVIPPWSPENPRQREEHVRAVHKSDNQEHGASEMTIESDGYPFHGPVLDRKGKLEYRRLKKVYQSIQANGYNREYGHVGVGLLKRGSDMLFLLQGSGFHRTSAMAARGEHTIPAMFTSPSIIDVDMVASWPQVRRGIWDRESAIAYVDYLFDFDSRAWAEEMGLLRSEGSAEN